MQAIALMYGKMMLYKNYPTNPNNWSHIFTAWNNLMGESSLQMWTDYPKTTTVDHFCVTHWFKLY